MKREECSNCGETFLESEQQAFDPEDNDHCPKCGERGGIVSAHDAESDESASAPFHLEPA